MRTNLSTAFFAALVLASITRCGSNSAGENTVKLQFNNTSRSFFQPNVFADFLRRGLRDETPSVFRMKLVAAYLAEDIEAGTGNNIGATKARFRGGSGLC